MRRHEFDPISFVFGMIFAVLGLAFLSGRVDLGDLHLRWLWPVPLIAVGLALLATTRNHDAKEPRPAVPPAEPAPEPDHEPDHEPDPDGDLDFDRDPHEAPADSASRED
jgi:hypothetical protein